MAKTLRLNVSKTAPAAAPVRQSVSQAGLPGEALADLGATITQTSAKIGNLVQRRRIEEAKDTISLEKANDKVTSAFEFDTMKEEFKDDPRGFTQALEQAQFKRHKKTLKGIDNDLARQELEKRFEMSRLENTLFAKSFERTQFVENEIKNIQSSALFKAKADHQRPESVEEFLVDLDTDLLDIRSRDMDSKKKLASEEAYKETRIQGILSGYTRGGAIRDFNRAHELVDQLGTRITPAQAEKFRRQIDSERQRQQNFNAFTERQDRTAINTQFQKEQQQFQDIFQRVADDPNADVTDDLKLLFSQGRFKNRNFTVVSEEKMTAAQKDQSENLKLSMLSQLAESNIGTSKEKSDEVARLRQSLIDNALSGGMSVEDASEVLDSIAVRTDKTFKRSEYRESDALLRNSVTTGFSFNKRVNREILTRMIRERDNIIREFGLTPSLASKVVLKERGKDLLPIIGRVPGLKADQNTVEGVQEAKRELADKIRLQKIDRKSAARWIETLQRRENVIQDVDVPTLKELRESR